jgi:hypothetical protein
VARASKAREAADRRRRVALLLIGALVAIWLFQRRDRLIELVTLIRRPLGVRGVVNPVPASGGADAESAADARKHAPGQVRTLERAVSLREFEDFARRFAGVAMARAALVSNGSRVVLAVAGHGGAHLDLDVLGMIQSELDRRRDPARGLDVIDYTEVPLRIEAAIEVRDGDHGVEEASREALLASLSRLDLGDSVDARDVLRALQSPSRVTAADLDLLRYREESDRISHGGSDVAVHSPLPINPWELAVLDPADLVLRSR